MSDKDKFVIMNHSAMGPTRLLADCPYNSRQPDTCFRCGKSLSECPCEPFTDDPRTTQDCKARFGEPGSLIKEYFRKGGKSFGSDLMAEEKQ